jgi:hypothetical protein
MRRCLCEWTYVTDPATQNVSYVGHGRMNESDTIEPELADQTLS